MKKPKSILSLLEYIDGCWYAVYPKCGVKVRCKDQYSAYVKQLELLKAPCPKIEPTPQPVPVPPEPPITEYTIIISYNEFENCSASASPILVSSGQSSTLTITAPDSVWWSVSATNAAIVGEVEGIGNATLELTDIIGNVNVEIVFEDASRTIRYKATSALTGSWVNNNTDTSKNTWNSETGNGVLYLNEGVESIEGTGSPFYNKQSITKVDLRNSELIELGNLAFCNCTGLTNIIISNSIINTGNQVFYGCNNIQFVNYIGTLYEWCLISFKDPYANPTQFSHNLYINGVLLTNLVIPANITEIKKYAFNCIYSITNITIPNSVTSIGLGSFSGCRGLTSITIPSSVISIGNNAFSSCDSVININIIRDNSFIDIGNSAFANCLSLTNINLSDKINNIGVGAFKRCSSLVSINIPNSITIINEETFRECTALTSITIPNSVQTIGEYAMANCTALTSITIPNSVQFIDKTAFAGCSVLETVIIGSSITELSNFVFINCFNIKSVTCYATNPPSIYDDTFETLDDSILYVPANSVQAYLADSYWNSAFNGNIQAISE